MTELNQTLSPGSFGGVREFLLRLVLSLTVAAIGPPALASGASDDPAVQQQPPAENRPQEEQQSNQNGGPERSAAAAASDFCRALATAATANDLPVDFFIRLIWQESRFKPDAISGKGAQGIAQFMPATARSNGLENPFDPFEAIAKSGERDASRCMPVMEL